MKYDCMVVSTPTHGKQRLYFIDDQLINHRDVLTRIPAKVLTALQRCGGGSTIYTTNEVRAQKHDLTQQQQPLLESSSGIADIATAQTRGAEEAGRMVSGGVEEMGEGGEGLGEEDSGDGEEGLGESEDGLDEGEEGLGESEEGLDESEEGLGESEEGLGEGGEGLDEGEEGLDGGEEGLGEEGLGDGEEGLGEGDAAVVGSDSKCATDGGTQMVAIATHGRRSLRAGHYPYPDQQSNYNAYPDQQPYYNYQQQPSNSFTIDPAFKTIAQTAIPVLVSIYSFIVWKWQLEMPTIPKLLVWLRDKPKEMFVNLIEKSAVKIQNKTLRTYFNHVAPDLANTIDDDVKNLHMFVLPFKLLELQKANPTNRAISRAFSLQAQLFSSLASFVQEGEKISYKIVTPSAFINLLNSKVLPNAQGFPFTPPSAPSPVTGNEFFKTQHQTTELNRATERVKAAEQAVETLKQQLVDQETAFTAEKAKLVEDAQASEKEREHQMRRTLQQKNAELLSMQARAESAEKMHATFNEHLKEQQQQLRELQQQQLQQQQPAPSSDVSLTVVNQLKEWLRQFVPVENQNQIANTNTIYDAITQTIAVYQTKYNELLKLSTTQQEQLAQTGALLTQQKTTTNRRDLEIRDYVKYVIEYLKDIQVQSTDVLLQDIQRHFRFESDMWRGVIENVKVIASKNDIIRMFVNELRPANLDDTPVKFNEQLTLLHAYQQTAGTICAVLQVESKRFLETGVIVAKINELRAATEACTSKLNDYEAYEKLYPRSFKFEGSRKSPKRLTQRYPGERRLGGGFIAQIGAPQTETPRASDQVVLAPRLPACLGVVESVHGAFVYLFPVELLQQVLGDARERGIISSTAKVSGCTVLHFLASLLDVNIIVATKRKKKHVRHERDAKKDNPPKVGLYKSVKCYLSENKSGNTQSSRNEKAGTTGDGRLEETQSSVNSNDCSVADGQSAPYIVVEVFRSIAHGENSAPHARAKPPTSTSPAPASASASASAREHRRDFKSRVDGFSTDETTDAKSGALNVDADVDVEIGVRRCYRLLFLGGSPWLSLDKVMHWLTGVRSECNSQCPRKFAPRVMQHYRNWLVSRVGVNVASGESGAFSGKR